MAVGRAQAFPARARMGRQSQVCVWSMPGAVLGPLMRLRHQLGERVGWHRSGHVEALCPPAPELFQVGELIVGLHALGADFDGERVGHGDDGADQRGVVGSVPSPSTKDRSTLTASTGKRLR